MNAQIEGRVAVVTGGSSGIGFETLRLLLGEGAKVAFCGRNPDRLASAHAALLNEYPAGDVFSWRCDVLNEQEVQAFANAVEAHCRPGLCRPFRRYAARGLAARSRTETVRGD